MRVHIIPDEKGNPPGKVADAEIHFTDETDGILRGLKLIGFGVWERRGGPHRYNVTFPARQYSINGERRSFALLRPMLDINASQTIRDLIIDTYTRMVDRDYVPARVQAEPAQGETQASAAT